MDVADVTVRGKALLLARYRQWRIAIIRTFLGSCDESAGWRVSCERVLTRIRHVRFLIGEGGFGKEAF